MKAVISSTYDDKYFWYLPLVTWLWNKLNVDVICFMPLWGTKEQVKNMIVMNAMRDMKFSIRYFECPKHKEATYAQCARLYASALDLPEHEVLITSDVDMGVFTIPHNYEGRITLLGVDLVPKGQLPMCYISGPVREWRKVFDINGRSVQNCLDDLLGDIDSITMRGDYWAKDQEEAYKRIIEAQPRPIEMPRARPGTQFATNRVDRDDINWRSYCGPALIDAHLWRPGYIDSNFANILELLQTQYPEDSFDWLIEYHQKYISIL